MTITAIRYLTALHIKQAKTGKTLIVDIETESDRFNAIVQALKAEYPGWCILEPGPCREVCLLADAG